MPTFQTITYDMALSSNNPPPTIGPKATNHEVREFLTDYLQRIDSEITSGRAWEMAREVTGDGEEAFQLHESEWKKLFGAPHGELVYDRFSCLKEE